ncbi:hypothetical protein [Kitasatospora purpeofusca]|uniref:hypothetical protein n=1 Tax=Kitasatospora purpeofusca TaxID=67352 RepID=UPI0036CE2299
MELSRDLNNRLRVLLVEAEWTQEHLARQVNRVAAESGVVLSLDRRSVSHWLSGRRPRPPVPDLVAEAFSRRLGRTLTGRDTGLVDGGSGQLGFGDGDVSAELSEVAALHRPRGVGSAGVYSAAALMAPAWDAVRGARACPPQEAAGRLTADDAVCAEQMVRVFADCDDAFGGGRSRSALASYLAQDLGPRLRAQGESRVRGRLLAAGVQLAYLCGFMCFDDGKHGAAQRYYRITLRLAAERGDPAGYAIALRAMSVQAGALGHHREAADLASAAIGTGALTGMRRAFLLGQVAVATAGDGDRAGALTALSAAERVVERAGSSGGEAMGGYHASSLAHQRAAVMTLLGDRPGAIEALAESIRDRPVHERRSRALTLAKMAELELLCGHLDAATQTWHRFLDDYPQLTSARADAAAARMRAMVRPHSRNRSVAALLARVPARGRAGGGPRPRG